MTAWDLFIDPIMVRGGHWTWEVDGVYFGIPLQNFWGWWLTTFVTFLIFLVFTRSLPQPSDGRNDRLAVLSYATTGLGNTVGAFLTGLAGPALVGFFAMAPWVVIGWIRSSSESRDTGKTAAWKSQR